MDTIQDLLPNEHFLDFGSGVIKLPDWFGTEPKNLIMGAGDLRHNNMLNVQMFNMFDVFFCKPWDWDGSLRGNMEYLLANHHHQKLLCFIDNDNMEQMDKFVALFAGRFRLIDGHLGHCPHLKLCHIHALLVNGGEAVNVFEPTSTCLDISEFDYWLTNGTFKIGNSAYLTGQLYDKRTGSLGVPDNLADDFMRRTLEKICSMPRNFINIAADVEADAPTMRMRELQQILYALTLDSAMPVTLTGTVCNYQRIWRQTICVELVITKRPVEFRNHDVEAYRVANGDNYVTFRIEDFKAAILNDIDRDMAWASQAKFRTLQKFININIP
jgi:hypothetical protein